MKLGVSHLKLLPLLAIGLAAAAIIVLAVLKPKSSPSEPIRVQAKIETPSGTIVPLEVQSYVGPTLEDIKKYLRVNEEGHFEISVANLFHTTKSLDVHRLLADQRIETTGQITFETPTDSKLSLAKLCDFGSGSFLKPARYSVSLEFEGSLPNLKHREWVRLVGKPVYKKENGQLSLTLRVDQVKATGSEESEVMPKKKETF